MPAALTICLFLLAFPVTLAGQQTLSSLSDTSRVKSGGVLALAGLGGMAVGVLGGGLIGIGFDDDDGLDAADGAFVGAVAGTSLAIPAAVHLANGRRGNLGRSILVSALVGGVLLGTGWAAESGELVVAAPIGQLISAVIIERNTSR
jgi:hypothetical protein